MTIFVAVSMACLGFLAGFYLGMEWGVRNLLDRMAVIDIEATIYLMSKAKKVTPEQIKDWKKAWPLCKP